MKSLAVFLVAVSLCALPLQAQNTKTIRVEQLIAENSNDQSVANLLTAKLVSYLVKYGVPVVETAGGETEADAVLTGYFQVVSNTYNGETRYRVQGAVRLTDKDGKVLWADDIRSAPYASSATSSFADHVAKKVAAFWGEPKRAAK